MEAAKKERLKKILISFLIAVFITVIVVIPLLTAVVYNIIFDRRFELDEENAYSVGDFKELRVDNCNFNSDNGQKLAGYKYYKENNSKAKGVIVIAHGMGCGGQNAFMEVADAFTSAGYLVFSYDATGNGTSEGDGIGGLPQGVADIDYALNFVKKQPEYQGLPIMLFGHSWGAYSVCAVLNFHSDIDAVISVAGFNQSSDLLEQQGEKYTGAAVNLLLPYVKGYERLLFGKYASATAMGGFEKTDTRIMVMHSKDDVTVPVKYGYEKYHDKYKNSDRFVFELFDDRGHFTKFDGELIEIFISFYDKSLE